MPDVRLFAINLDNPSRMEWTNGALLLISERSVDTIREFRFELDPRAILDSMPASEYNGAYREAGKDASQLAADVLRAIAAPFDLGA